MEAAGFNHLPIIGGHAAKVVELPSIHKDPFDRLLVAQAGCGMFRWSRGRCG